MDRADGIVREERWRECNIRAKEVGGIRKDINDVGKDLERDHGEAGTYGDAFASSKAKVRRHASDINGARERSKGDKADWKDAIDRVEAAEGR